MENLATKLRSQEQWDREGTMTTLQSVALLLLLFILQGAVIIVLTTVLLSSKFLPSLVFPAKKPPRKRLNFHIT